MTYDKHVDIYDVPLAILVILIGVIGALFSGSYTERYHRNRKRASDLLRELDNATPRFDRPLLSAIEANADDETWSKRRFSVFRKISSSHWLWLAFPILVTILGCVLAALAIKCGQCPAPK